jgi:hypothetical protein
MVTLISLSENKVFCTNSDTTNLAIDARIRQAKVTLKYINTLHDKKRIGLTILYVVNNYRI